MNIGGMSPLASLLAGAASQRSAESQSRVHADQALQQTHADVVELSDPARQFENTGTDGDRDADGRLPWRLPPLPVEENDTQPTPRQPRPSLPDDDHSGAVDLEA